MSWGADRIKLDRRSEPGPPGPHVPQQPRLAGDDHRLADERPDLERHARARDDGATRNSSNTRRPSRRPRPRRTRTPGDTTSAFRRFFSDLGPDPSRQALPPGHRLDPPAGRRGDTRRPTRGPPAPGPPRPSGRPQPRPSDPGRSGPRHEAHQRAATRRSWPGSGTLVAWSGTLATPRPFDPRIEPLDYATTDPFGNEPRPASTIGSRRDHPSAIAPDEAPRRERRLDRRPDEAHRRFGHPQGVRHGQGR